MIREIALQPVYPNTTCRKLMSRWNWNVRLWLQKICLQRVRPEFYVVTSCSLHSLTIKHLLAWFWWVKRHKPIRYNFFIIGFPNQALSSQLKFRSRICKLVQTSQAYNTAHVSMKDRTCTSKLPSVHLTFCSSVSPCIRLRENLTKQTNS